MATPPAPVSATKRVLPAREKLAYGAGSVIDMWGNWLYPGLIWIVFNIALGVPPWLVSTALMLNRLFDAVSDPFFGWWSDNTRTRWGRRRPFILVGAILAGLFLPMLVTVPRDWSEHGYFVYMVVSSAIYITIVSCCMVPFNSLGYEMTSDPQERTSVFAFKSAFQKIPEIALFAGAAFSTSTVWAGATAGDALSRLGMMLGRAGSWFADIFSHLFAWDFSGMGVLLANAFYWATPTDQPVNSILGAQVYTVILGSIMILVGVIMFLTVKERYYGVVTRRKQEKIRIRETFWEVLKCRPFRANLSMAFAYAMGTAMVGTLGYYATVFYVCGGDVSVGSVWNFWMGASNSLLGLIGVAFYARLSRRLGKRGTMGTVLVMAMTVFVATWWLYTPEVVWMQLFASGFISFTGAGFWMLYGSIGADIIDYDELESGKRREGAFTACSNWIMKVGQAVGIGASGFVLSATGFDASLGADQAPGAIWNIRFFLAAIPVVGLAIAVFMLSRMTLSDKRVAEISAELESRRGSV